MSIVYTLIILCVLVIAHEFGHFVVAKLNGIYVEEFAVGMGPKLIGWGNGETKYSIRLFPIGGYVKMMGEDEDVENERAFCNKGVPARMAVTFAGPAMNFVIAVVFFMVAFMHFGLPAGNGLVGGVEPGLPAAAAGMVEGDVVLGLDDVEIRSWDDISAFMAAKQPGDEVEITFSHAGERVSATVRLAANADGRALLGVTQGMARADFINSIKLGFVTTINFTLMILQSLWQMVTGEIAVEVAGPVGMVTIVGEYADVGLTYLLLFAGILSVNLGIMNLLPIPALDGSRLVFLIIEGIRRKPIDRDKEAMVNFIGFALLITLMLVVTYFDIEKLLN